MRARLDTSHAGIAVGRDAVVAVAGRGEAARVVAVPIERPDASDPAQLLESAFRELHTRLTSTLGQAGRLHVSIALLPPFADTRLLALPPLRLREAEAVIRRDVARYFVGGSGARTVAVARAGIAARAVHGPSTTTVLAAAAPTAVIENVRAAALRNDWVVDRIVPAHGAWIGLHAHASNHADRREIVLAVHGDDVVLIGFENGEVTRIRQLPIDLHAEIAAATGAGPGQAFVVGEDDESTVAGGVLRGQGWTRAELLPGMPSAMEAAAAHAHRSPIEFVPPSLVAERWRRTRTLARRMAVGAVALVVLAGVLEMWGVRRELAAVRHERALIREQVAPLLEARDSIDHLTERTRAIHQIDDEAPRWTRALFDLALLLPADAHVTTLRTRGDTLVIEAAGARAGEAIQALRRAGSLTDVRLEGVVDRDLEDGATAVERFRVSARLKRAAVVAGRQP